MIILQGFLTQQYADITGKYAYCLVGGAIPSI